MVTDVHVPPGPTPVLTAMTCPIRRGELVHLIIVIDLTFTSRTSIFKSRWVCYICSQLSARLQNFRPKTLTTFTISSDHGSDQVPTYLPKWPKPEIDYRSMTYTLVALITRLMRQLEIWKGPDFRCPIVRTFQHAGMVSAHPQQLFTHLTLSVIFQGARKRSALARNQLETD